MGPHSFALDTVIRFASPPSKGTNHKSDKYEKQTVSPSGDIAGSSKKCGSIAFKKRVNKSAIKINKFLFIILLKEISVWKPFCYLLHFIALAYLYSGMMFI